MKLRWATRSLSSWCFADGMWAGAVAAAEMLNSCMLEPAVAVRSGSGARCCNSLQKGVCVHHRKDVIETSLQGICSTADFKKLQGMPVALSSGCNQTFCTSVSDAEG